MKFIWADRFFNFKKLEWSTNPLSSVYVSQRYLKLIKIGVVDLQVYLIFFVVERDTSKIRITRWKYSCQNLKIWSGRPLVFCPSE